MIGDQLNASIIRPSERAQSQLEYIPSLSVRTQCSIVVPQTASRFEPT
jgi:hypothetical protein